MAGNTCVFEVCFNAGAGLNVDGESFLDERRGHRRSDGHASLAVQGLLRHTKYEAEAFGNQLIIYKHLLQFFKLLSYYLSCDFLPGNVLKSYFNTDLRRIMPYYHYLSF